MAVSDTDAVKQVKERIIRLAREIEELSKSDVPPESFFPEFLRRIIEAIGARAGAVWLMDEQNRLGLHTEIGLAGIGFFENPRANSLNQRILGEVLQNGQAGTFGGGEASEIEPPTADLVIVAALQKDKKPVGVLEIFQRADTRPESRPGFLQFVEQMTGFACRYLERPEKVREGAASSVQMTNELENFLLRLHRSLNVNEVANTAANDGRLLLGCDRLSVAIQHGSKVIIKSISGQDKVNQRANLVRTMRGLAMRVLAMSEPLKFSGRSDNLPPQIEKPLADYIQESGSRMVHVIPLLEPDPIIKEDDKPTGRKPAPKRKKVVGGIIVEQVAESQPRQGLEDRAELLADHVSVALHNAQVHQGLFLQPLMAAIGKFTGWFRGRVLLKTLAAMLCIAALGAALAVVPWDYRVEGEGQLMPVIQQNIFCPWDGEVEEILVVSGQRVEAGQPVLKIKNDELAGQLSRAKNELLTKKEEEAGLAARVQTSRNLTRDEVIQLNGQLATVREEIIGAENEVKILSERAAKLNVVSPISGVVATFQIEQKLLNRPVRRGEVLLEVMDDTGEWRLELEVEENRTGHLLRAQQKQNNPALPVEFILATAPEQTFEGHLTEMATRAVPNEELGNVIEVFTAIDSKDLPNRRIGAEVTAKINCGKRALGYVLFGDVIEFVRKYFWL